MTDRKSLKFIALSAMVFTAIAISASAFAQETQPGDACLVGEDGWYKRSSMATSTDGGNMLFCDGANWVSFLNYLDDGYLGVWNTSPTSALDITGTATMDALNLNGVTGLGAPTTTVPDVINDLSDVIITTPANTEVLTYNGTNWVNSAVGGGLWTEGAGDDIYYNTGTPKVGIGTTTPAGELHIYDSASWGILNIEGDESLGSYIRLLTKGDGASGENASTEGWLVAGYGETNATASNRDDFQIVYWDGTTYNRNFVISNSGDVGIGDTSPDVELDVAGDIEYTGTIADMSDRRLKSDIQNIPAGQLEKITALQGVTFKMKNDPEGEVEKGFIAQDVQEIYPSLVYERGDEGMLSMNYVGLIAPMVEALKEQQSYIRSLEARIEALEKQ